jgi:5'-3' exonuclease
MFESIMRQYANQFRVMKRHFIDPKSLKMDLLAVKQWFETFYGKENDMIRKYTDTMRTKKPYMQQTSGKYPTAAQKELDELRIEPYRRRSDTKRLQVIENAIRDVDNPYQNWRDVYYHWYFGIESLEVNQDFVESVCRHYLYGLDWNIQYYIVGCKEQSWYYPFRAAPALRELVMYLTKQLPILPPMSKQVQIAYTPIEQLLFVLPISSADILPKAVKPYMANSHYYPDKVKFDMLGKIYLYECNPYLPYLPEEIVKRIVEKTQSSWNAFDQVRNQRRTVVEV